jgi:hypothetical protein
LDIPTITRSLVGQRDICFGEAWLTELRQDRQVLDRIGRTQTRAHKPGAGPDFFGYIYGPQATVRVPKDAPPMFSAIAFDDPLFPTMGFPIAAAWHKAKRPVEVHAYERGGHGFGLGVEGTTTTLLFEQFVAWMDMQGFLKHDVAK